VEVTANTTVRVVLEADKMVALSVERASHGHAGKWETWLDAVASRRLATFHDLIPQAGKSQRRAGGAE